MTSTKTRVLLVLAAFGALLALSVGVAKAQTNGDLYLEVLHEQGIYSSKGDAALVELGYTACGYLHNGYTEAQVANLIYQLNALSVYDSGYVLGAAEAAFCPDAISARSIA